MTPKEVAQYLRVHVRTIYRLAKSGRIPSRKIGGSWRFRKEQLDLWLSETKYSASPGKEAPGPEKGGELESPQGYRSKGR
jgi:excisionase family DNA binding protein